MRQKWTPIIIFCFVLSLLLSTENCQAGAPQERTKYIEGALSGFEEERPKETPAEKTESAQITHEFEAGLEISDFTYKEPGLMIDQGTLQGISCAYTLRGQLPPSANNGMFRIEGLYNWGQVDYDGALWDGTPYSQENIDDYIIELRLLFGTDFKKSETITLTPYIGFGYRYLNDDSSFDPSGYERESNYYYVPIGIDVVKQLRHGWSVGFRVEYDGFCQGKQESHLSDVDPGFGDYSNKQKKGYGFRGSVRIQRKILMLDFMLEPFFRYWNIKESEWTPLLWYGVPDPGGLGLVEPKNRSRQLGCKAAILF